MSELLNTLTAHINEVIARTQEPAELIAQCAPVMSREILAHPEAVHAFIKTLEWPAEDEPMYHRVRVAEGEDGAWSLYAITWNEGQVTPIHDHGTWGVVGVLEGALCEHMMMRVDGGDGDEGVELIPSGVCILQPGSVNTFMPEPDHIHRSGPLAGPTASLHLYGRLMTSYNMYDLATKRREPLPVE
jgi:predicted metal-dependent enzyme (double-stranded beta helix superfamily)